MDAADPEAPLRQAGLPLRARRVAWSLQLLLAWPRVGARPARLRAGGAGCGGGPPRQRAPGSTRRWRRSRRSTPSCCGAGSWSERCPRASGSWWRRWRTWPRRRWPRSCAPGRWPMSRPEKITPLASGAAAVVYVRQSTLAQVREHAESTQRQYGLAADAERLGWPAARVEVIDDDLGLSGRSAGGRSGFRELVGRVCVGEVGAILGLEVSRLARSCADLQRLLELAPDRHAGRRRRRRLRPGRLQRPAAARAEGHDVRGRAAPARRPACRAPSGRPPSAASCASRCRSASSTTTRAGR